MTFIQKAIKKHGSKYDYSLAKYKNSKTKVKIICPEHGIFKQTLNNHLSGHGCPKCRSSLIKEKLSLLYYIQDLDTGYYKIGITNKTIEERFGKQERIKVIKTWQYENGQEAYDREQEILKEFSSARIINESWENMSGGKTEFFTYDIMGLDMT